MAQCIVTLQDSGTKYVKTYPTLTYTSVDTEALPCNDDPGSLVTDPYSVDVIAAVILDKGAESHPNSQPPPRH